MSSTFNPELDESFEYGTAHDLQTLTVDVPNSLSKTPDPSKCFLIYIHGGAWRSPAQSAADFDPARNLILNTAAYSDILPRIAGFASINYGLSSPSSNPSRIPGRNYKYPQHLQDIRLALDWLRERYNIGATDGWNYILIGHSCGATMAFQITSSLTPSGTGYRSPLAVVGIEGLYDLPLLLKNFPDPFYRQFVTDAFGDSEQNWADWSPVNDAKLGDTVTSSTVLTIAHSDDDELVDWAQAEAMKLAISKCKGKEKTLVVSLKGSHDDVWQKGVGVAEAIRQTLNKCYETE
ncbi:alpha/beta-hydrolase [Microthyrium microscopicum]|uniref:Kynurenine formamidase n=1 Tax=Microthyrium microscopicum TaxID=703497 RepID=A0A6A6U7C2_9PEZI|nr:alpha/beta-hydrolase [Microthyrium microscopicum]